MSIMMDIIMVMLTTFERGMGNERVFTADSLRN
jgi:hypothetical protein